MLLSHFIQKWLNFEVGFQLGSQWLVTAWFAEVCFCVVGSSEKLETGHLKPGGLFLIFHLLSVEVFLREVDAFYNQQGESGVDSWFGVYARKTWYQRVHGRVEHS